MIFKNKIFVTPVVFQRCQHRRFEDHFYYRVTDIQARTCYSIAFLQKLLLRTDNKLLVLELKKGKIEEKMGITSFQGVENSN